MSFGFDFFLSVCLYFCTKHSLASVLGFIAHLYKLYVELIPENKQNLKLHVLDTPVSMYNHRQQQIIESQRLVLQKAEKYNNNNKTELVLFPVNNFLEYLFRCLLLFSCTTLIFLWDSNSDRAILSVIAFSNIQNIHISSFSLHVIYLCFKKHCNTHNEQLKFKEANEIFRQVYLQIASIMKYFSYVYNKHMLFG